jgi:hypothetical protein
VTNHQYLKIQDEICLDVKSFADVSGDHDNSMHVQINQGEVRIPAFFENCHSPLFQNQHSPSLSENHHLSSQSETFLKFTLPSTKNISILNGKHNWGLWHTAIWTLIDCLNLFGHIHENMLPGALYDPDLKPSFLPVISCESLQYKEYIYSE